MGGEIRSRSCGSRTHQLQLEVDVFGEGLEPGTLSCMECNMCGDVGFPDHLLHCSRCREHQEHSYCSPSYLELGYNKASWVCDWCWPAVKRESDLKSQSKGQEVSVKLDDQKSGRHFLNTSGPVHQNQNGLDLLLEVARATVDLSDLPSTSSSTKFMERKLVRCTTGSAGREREVPRIRTSSTTTVALEASPSKPSSGGSKRKQQGLGSDRWSATQKRVCSARNYENICARTGIRSLETSNGLPKGLGRRYRLLSSMLC